MSAATNQPAPALLGSLLKDVSRTYYLTMRVLPSSIRRQIGLAYLLARTTDTIADTGLVPLGRRLDALRALRERIVGANRTPVDFRDLAGQQGSPAEKMILERCEEALALLAELNDADLQRVRDVLSIITSGQELDLRRFDGASEKCIAALKTDEELDDYTYRVAGCVGEFWTRMCRTHAFPGARLDDNLLLKNGVRFGKGLQLVNILRDLPADLRLGRCYLPAPALAGAGVRPEDLLDPANEPRFRALYSGYLDLAQAHLSAGWDYTNILPSRCIRIRLACAWPILIGVRTLGKLRSGNVLDPKQRIKVSRPEVKNLILKSVVSCAWPPAWRRLYSSALEGPKAVAR